ncbi:hypothetical protein GCM10011371_33070 [Novosphingobium marinum]|uniref:Pimeloyl-ACP methyl ester carboxylesterase n=1 Tax=Novosphingobium marinum TaxID=1514948 RepID=A0A7Y9XYN9_9SPHN|nr:alpha/beta hydrolase [Novosphingobium marinum]NYH97032.1 pimeloyl-ACP methyl ester carboxylesterase [Novosphingobium marinum]GGC43029.1 hypothetical protein GCM10011371_33070 [Novosphingobium marinum]
MPFAQNGDAEIYYEVSGRGYPLLLLASGFMNSRIDSWYRHVKMEPAFRFNPLVEFASTFTMVAMDQRNAMGRSFAPIQPTYGWEDFARDQIAAMDAAGFETFHVWGSSIGATFALELCKLVPERVTSVVVMNGMGVRPDDPGASLELYRGYAEQLLAERPGSSMENIMAVGENLFAKDFEQEFAFSVTREFLQSCDVPMLILPAYDDAYHPMITAEEISTHVPNARLDRDWTKATSPAPTEKLIREFLQTHTPR